MNSRDHILNAIRSVEMDDRPLPEFNLPPIEGGVDLVQRYQQALGKNGGKAILIDSINELTKLVKRDFLEAKTVCSLIKEVEGTLAINTMTDPHLLENIDLAIIQSKVGVAENAATWLQENEIVHRVLPFITQHLIIVIHAQDIVPTMHEAYQRINLRDQGYGVFIAGPSKTADIEQSLVIGAHGARSLSVAVIGN